MSSILSVGQSALAAAQAGLTTTGHNIANANTPGYTRQVIVQSNASGQDQGYGFIGKGTQVTGVKRIFDEYLNSRVLTTQSSYYELSAYHTHVKQINNMLADTTTGFSPTLQDFFKGVQNVASDPSSGPARQSMLSSAETLASQFRTMDTQLREATSGVNTQILTSIKTVNSYAQQLAQLNDAIEKAQAGDDRSTPNDLLDQRDQLISDLSKELKVTIVKQNDSYNVFVGSGQPLVVGAKAFSLVATTSPTDVNRVQVGYEGNGGVVRLAENSITGGTLGGLFEYRSQSLDNAQNAMGRIAIVLADTFNAQHKLGQDLNGNLGKDVFQSGLPQVNASTLNTGDAIIDSSITNARALTGSDYRLTVDGGGNFLLSRRSDGKLLSSGTLADAQAAATGEGFSLTLKSGSAAAGDEFLIRPTANGAFGFSVLLKNPSEIAAASPMQTAAGTINATTGVITNTNRGLGSISPGAVAATTLFPNGLNLGYDGTSLTGIPSNYEVTVVSGGVTTVYPPGTAVPYTAGDTVSFGGVQLSGIPTVLSPPAPAYTAGPVRSTMTYNAGDLTGFPDYLDVTVKTAAGTTTTYPAGTPVPWSDGATISYGGISFKIGGTPQDGDQFSVGANVGGVGDKRNMVLLAGLQTSQTIGNGSVSYQGAYGQLVNTIGNKTRELDVTSKAQQKMMSQAIDAQQSVSGVNLDEEATNLLRYQQAYEAAGKVMATAARLFDVLLTIGS